jgi:hypothetical protein
MFTSRWTLNRPLPKHETITQGKQTQNYIGIEETAKKKLTDYLREEKVTDPGKMGDYKNTLSMIPNFPRLNMRFMAKTFVIWDDNNGEASKKMFENTTFSTQEKEQILIYFDLISKYNKSTKTELPIEKEEDENEDAE